MNGENNGKLIKMDDLGVPLFFGNTQMLERWKIHHVQIPQLK